MGLTDKIGIAILCAFVLFSVVRLFAAPLKLAAKVLLNTALGFLAPVSYTHLGVAAR